MKVLKSVTTSAFLLSSANAQLADKCNIDTIQSFLHDWNNRLLAIGLGGAAVGVDLETMGNG